jgi:hypothetical protein
MPAYGTTIAFINVKSYTSGPASVCPLLPVLLGKSFPKGVHYESQFSSEQRYDAQRDRALDRA